MKNKVSVDINNETLLRLEIIALNKKIKSCELIESILEEYLKNKNKKEE